MKFFASAKWRERFTHLASTFEEHKKNLQLELQLRVTATVADIKTSMDAMMKLVFDHMRSPQEREVAAFVRSKGSSDPARITADDALLSEIYAQVAPKVEQKSTGSKPTSETAVNLVSVRKEIAQDPGTISNEDANTFKQKWDAFRDKLDELKHVVVQEGDRVISAFNSGPHERIVDKVSMPNRRNNPG